MTGNEKVIDRRFSHIEPVCATATTSDDTGHQIIEDAKIRLLTPIHADANF
jgi:hypothetical protein